MEVVSRPYGFLRSIRLLRSVRLRSVRLTKGIVLGLLNPRWLQMTYHAAGGGCRNWACQARSWSFGEAAWTGAGSRWGTGPLAQTCRTLAVLNAQRPQR